MTIIKIMYVKSSFNSISFLLWKRGRCSRNHMVVGFTITCAISAYHHKHWEFEPCSWRCVLDTTLCDKVCQWLM